MATGTDLGGVWNTTNTAAAATRTLVVATPRPTADVLIVVVHGQSGWADGETGIMTDDNAGGGGTYTRIGTASVPLAEGGGTNGALWISVRNALLTSNTSTTFTMTQQVGAQSGGGITVLAFTGITRVGPQAIRRSSGRNNQSGDPPDMTWANSAPPQSPPNTNNPVICAIMGEDNPVGVTQPTGFTLAEDSGWATPTAGIQVAWRDSGETNATLTWGTSGGLLTDYCLCAVELDTTAVSTRDSMLGGGILPFRR